MEWFASLYLNSTDRYDDFEWYKVRKKKPKLSYKKKMRDIRKKKRLQKSLERAYKKQKNYTNSIYCLYQKDPIT